MKDTKDAMTLLRSSVLSFVTKIRSEYGLKVQITEKEFNFKVIVFSPKGFVRLGEAIFEVYGDLENPLMEGCLAPWSVSMPIWEPIYRKHAKERLTLTP